jgi:hypothetical protein
MRSSPSFVAALAVAATSGVFGAGAGAAARDGAAVSELVLFASDDTARIARLPRAPAKSRTLNTAKGTHSGSACFAERGGSAARRRETLVRDAPTLTLGSSESDMLAHGEVEWCADEWL